MDTRLVRPARPLLRQLPGARRLRLRRRPAARRQPRRRRAAGRAHRARPVLPRQRGLAGRRASASCSARSPCWRASCSPASTRPSCWRPGRRDPGHRRRAAAQPAGRRRGPGPAGTGVIMPAACSPRSAGALLLAGLLQGVPLHADGHVAGVGHLATPFVAATALAMVTLVAVHGATFLALRLPRRRRRRSAALARRLVPVALAAVALATVVGLLSARVRDAVQRPRWPYSCRCCSWRRCWRPARRWPGGGRAGRSSPLGRPWRCRCCWSARPSGPTCWCPRRPGRLADGRRRGRQRTDPAAAGLGGAAAAAGPTRLPGDVLVGVPRTDRRQGTGVLVSAPPVRPASAAPGPRGPAPSCRARRCCGVLAAGLIVAQATALAAVLATAADGRLDRPALAGFVVAGRRPRGAGLGTGHGLRAGRRHGQGRAAGRPARRGRPARARAGWPGSAPASSPPWPAAGWTRWTPTSPATCRSSCSASRCRWRCSPGSSSPTGARR